MPSYGDLSTASEIFSEICLLAPRKFEIECVVIDESLGADVFWEERPNLRVIQPPFRLGAQSALVEYFRTDSEFLDNFDLVCTLDSDGEDEPSDVWRLCTSHDENIDISIATRISRTNTAAFKLGYAVFKILYRVATGLPLKSGSFAIVRAKWLKKNIYRSEFSFSYTGAILSLPATKKFIPCKRGARRKGLSKMKTIESVIDGLRIMLPQAGRIAARSFVLLVAASVFWVIGIAIVLAYKITNSASPGWATSFIVLLTVVIGFALNLTVGALAIFAIVRKDYLGKDKL